MNHWVGQTERKWNNNQRKCPKTGGVFCPTCYETSREKDLFPLHVTSEVTTPSHNQFPRVGGVPTSTTTSPPLSSAFNGWQMASAHRVKKHKTKWNIQVEKPPLVLRREKIMKSVSTFVWCC